MKTQTVIGVSFSCAGAAVAVAAAAALAARQYSNAMLFAGAALFLACVPLMPYTKEMFTAPIQHTIEESVRKPLPLYLRIMVSICWLLMIGGIAVAFI